MHPLVGMTCTLDGQFYRFGMHYVEAIERAGGVVVALPPVEQVERVLQIVRNLDAILLPGGSDIDPSHFGEEVLPENGWIEPGRDRLELAVARLALAEGIPLLGICRGAQVINVAAGGDLYQDIYTQTASRLQHRQQAPDWYPTHRIQVASGSRLAGILNVPRLRVNTFHHQAVRRIGNQLRAVAHSDDGLVEAVEAPNHPFAIGVQWHPEIMAARDGTQQKIFDAFVQAAAERRRAA